MTSAAWCCCGPTAAPSPARGSAELAAERLRAGLGADHELPARGPVEWIR